jgi:hypothetical protein
LPITRALVNHYLACFCHSWFNHALFFCLPLLALPLLQALILDSFLSFLPQWRALTRDNGDVGDTDSDGNNVCMGVRLVCDAATRL